MTDTGAWSPMDGAEWQRRVHAADLIRQRWTLPGTGPEGDEQAHRWLASIDTTAYVGSRHHTVPRFLLQRWADDRAQVRTYRRIEGRHGVENIKDLAIRDFYTVINTDGSKSSALESVMGHVESSAKPYIDQVLNPFNRPVPLELDAYMALGQFATFQATRTARRRRELELQSEWHAKTMAAGQVTDDELRRLKIVPHQNQTAMVAAQTAAELTPYFICRPLAVVTLNRPMLYMCDEPVVLNAPDGAFHLPDCALTDAQIEARVRRQMRKVKQRKRARAVIRGRTVHFSSTMPTGYGVADEILLAISPSVALLWGPLAQDPLASRRLRGRRTPARRRRRVARSLVPRCPARGCSPWCSPLLCSSVSDPQAAAATGPAARPRHDRKRSPSDFGRVRFRSAVSVDRSPHDDPLA